MDNLKDFRRTLHKSGYRVTGPRLAVAKVLLEADDWLAPEEIHRRGQTYHAALGLVTVYRTLDLLEELGRVRRIHVNDGCHGYVRTELSHGHHLVCRSCQQVVEFPGSEDLDGLMEGLAQRTGFLIEDHLLELSGVCPGCQDSVSEGEVR
ncbi:MAG: Fur family transcriptional regulator [Anaerolineales bacterium]|nr:Fur family transcriptional regulator [Anaerolineales bacterium]